jgi:hypothetical protein
MNAKMTAMQPELLIFVGLGTFIALSFLTFLLDNKFPSRLPWICQVAALLGFVSFLPNSYIFRGTEESLRFMYCYSYVIAALATSVIISVYGLKKLQLRASVILSAGLNIPTFITAAYLLTNYISANSRLLPLIEATSIVGFITAFGVGSGIFAASWFSNKTNKKSALGEVNLNEI